MNHTLNKDIHLRIALGLPEWLPFQQAMDNLPADATYVIQRNLTAGLRDRGHAVTFFAPRGVEEFIVTTDHRHAKRGVRTWSESASFTFASKAIWKLQNLLGIPYLNVFSNYRYLDASLQSLPGHDVVFERNGLYNSGLAMACRRLNIPYVIFFEADQIMELDIMGKPLTGLLRRRAQQLLRFNLNSADAIVCVSKAGRDHLIQQWNVPSRKVTVFPNAVDIEKFKPDPQAREKVRRDLNLGNAPIILFVGNFFHWHDVPTLLDAFALVVKIEPRAKLLLVGDGDRRPEMMERASALGLGESAIFTGIVPHPEVPRFIAAADMAVVPYPPMQRPMWLSPLKLFEYMSSGKAVVASAIGQINDVMKNQINGMLVPPGDASALAAAITSLIHEDALRARIGEQARADAIRQFSWETYLARLERVFHAAIDRQPVDSI